MGSSSGTSPSHAARSRPRSKVSAFPTAAIKAEAIVAPTPGIVARRRASSFSFVYLTTFDNQTVLTEVLQYYGFAMTGTNSLGEQIYEKALPREQLVSGTNDNLFDLARLNYPRFTARPPATAFCIPIQSEFHEILFPELAAKVQFELFAEADLNRGDQASRHPGNTIRKVYLCRAMTQQLRPGSIVLFYRSFSPGYLASQSITSVGVVEAMHQAASLDDLVRLTGKRSVYSEAKLAGFEATAERPVKVIDFLLVGHIEPAIKLDDLKRMGVFRGGPPQSISQLTEEKFEPVRDRMAFGFAV